MASVNISFYHLFSVFNPFDTSAQLASNGSTDPFGMSSFNSSQKSPDTLNNSINTMDRAFLDLQVGCFPVSFSSQGFEILLSPLVICSNFRKVELDTIRNVVSFLSVLHSYAPNLDRVEGAYWFGPVRLCVCVSVLCDTCIRSQTVRDRILKFYMWNKYEN